MLINEKKSKYMVFNFTNKYQFSTRLSLGKQTLEEVAETKLLGTTLTNNLKWDTNTQNIIKKANARMQILRIASSFSPNLSDLKLIYISYIRSRLEQSCIVWHSGLSKESSDDLERVQKSALKVILKDSYKNYNNALNQLDLETLKERREYLCLKFAKKNLKNKKINYLFPPNNKTHIMDTRNQENFNIDYANTTRLQNSPIIFMQKLLNDNRHTITKS